MSDLRIAAINGDLSTVRTLLEADPSLLWAKNEHGDTGFHLAARFGRENVVDYFLSIKADINAVGQFGRNVLMLAAECNTDNSSVISKLLRAGAQVNEQSKEGMVTALSLAAGYGHIHNMTTLINAQADVKLGDKNAIQPIHYAAEHPTPSVITALINAGASVNAQTNYHSTPIMKAASDNKADNIHHLLNYGANMSMCNKAGNTALHMAAKKEFEQCVVILLKAGINRDIKNNHGKTALDIGIDKKNEKIISLLKETPRPPALHQAFHDNKPKEAQKLLESGCDVDESDQLGRTALHVVCSASNVAFTKLLLKYKANPDVFDEDMNCPIHLACAIGSQSMVQALLPAADLNLPNQAGLTPLMLAAAAGHIHVIKILTKKPGLELDSLDNEGNNVVHHVARGGSIKVLQYLETLEGIPDIDSRNNQNESPLVVAAKARQAKVVKAILIKIFAIKPNLERSMSSLSLDARSSVLPKDMENTRFENEKDEEIIKLVLKIKDSHNL